jgi:hypothetical protein
VNKFNSDHNVQSLISGGLYYKEAPQDVSAPWAVFTIPTIDRDEFMGTATDARKTATVDVHVYSRATDGGDEVDLICELFGDLFDWSTLYVNGYSVDSVKPVVSTQMGMSKNIHENVMSYEIGMMKE